MHRMREFVEFLYLRNFARQFSAAGGLGGNENYCIMLTVIWLFTAAFTLCTLLIVALWNFLPFQANPVFWPKWVLLTVLVVVGFSIDRYVEKVVRKLRRNVDANSIVPYEAPPERAKWWLIPISIPVMLCIASYALSTVL